MSKKKHIIFYSVVAALFLLSGCNCSTPTKIRPIQTSDKNLACQEIILEMNEAEFYKREASETKGVGFNELLTPTCWVTGYLDSNSAMKDADERIEYLGNIYDLLDCGGKSAAKAEDQSAMTQQPIQQPIQQPMQQPIVMPNPVPGQYPDQQMMPQADMQQQQGFTDEESEPQIMDSQESTKAFDPNMHGHVKGSGEVYYHSHQNNGPHTHKDSELGKDNQLLNTTPDTNLKK